MNKRRTTKAFDDVIESHLGNGYVSKYCGGGEGFVIHGHTLRANHYFSICGFIW